MEHVALVVEGAHNAAFFGRLLRRLDYRQIRLFDEIRPFWKALIPREYPFRKSGELDRYVSCPSVYERDDSSPSIAIKVAGGDSMLSSTVETIIDNIDAADLTALGIVLDADRATPAIERFAAILEKLRKLNTVWEADRVPGLPLRLPTTPGQVAIGAPRVGIYVLPDNSQAGTLETILLACAEISYPRICRRARDVVAAIDCDGAPQDPDLKNLRKPSGREKAAASIIANIVEPGSSLAVAVENGRWLGEEAFAEPSVSLAFRFLCDLIGPNSS